MRDRRARLLTAQLWMSFFVFDCLWAGYRHTRPLRGLRCCILLGISRIDDALARLFHAARAYGYAAPASCRPRCRARTTTASAGPNAGIPPNIGTVRRPRPMNRGPSSVFHNAEFIERDGLRCGQATRSPGSRPAKNASRLSRARKPMASRVSRLALPICGSRKVLSKAAIRGSTLGSLL